MGKVKTFNQLIIDRKNHLVLLDGKPIEHGQKLTLELDGWEWDLRIERVEFYTGSTREEKAESGKETKSEKKMDKYTTEELIEEIAKRKCVRKYIAEPNNEVAVRAVGPAVILAVLGQPKS